MLTQTSPCSSLSRSTSSSEGFSKRMHPCINRPLHNGKGLGAFNGEAEVALGESQHACFGGLELGDGPFGRQVVPVEDGH